MTRWRALRWWLAAAFIAGPAHALGPAHELPAPDDGALRPLWAAMGVVQARTELPTPEEEGMPRRSAGERTPRRSAGEWMPAACANERSLPWMPRVTLPHPERAGHLALDWRLDDSPDHRRTWLAITGAAALLSLVLAVGLRRRRGWRRLAWPVAFSPAVLGLILSHRILARAAEGLAVPWSCVPREEIFQRHAQLARDALAAGSLSSLVALVVLGLAAAVAWRPLRLRAVAPMVALLAGTAWLEWRRWPAGREGELARQVSGSLASVEARGIRLPAASALEPVTLPDVPVVTVSADGALAYDDSRGLLPATPLPLLLPGGDWQPSSDRLDRPPFFLLAIDERTPWQTLRRAIAPLDALGYGPFSRLLYGPVEPATPGAAARGRRVSGWAHMPAMGSVYTTSSSQYPLDVQDGHLLVGWLDAGALRMQGERGELGEGCAGVGPGVAIPGLARESAARCIAAIEGEEGPGRTLDKILLLVPSATTPWRDVALIREAIERPRPDGAVRLHIEVLDDSEQARHRLARQHDWLLRHRGTDFTGRADRRAEAFWELLERR